MRRERVRQHPHRSSSSRPLRTRMRMLLGVLQCHHDAQKSHAEADAGSAGDGFKLSPMEDMQIGYLKGEMSLRELTNASLTNYRLQRNFDNRSPSISIPSVERTSGTIGSRGPRTSTSLDLATRRCPARKLRLRRHVDVEAGEVRGVEARPPCSTSHARRREEELGESGGGVRRSSGRQAVAAMVE
jgi:hypothetical protein